MSMISGLANRLAGAFRKQASGMGDDVAKRLARKAASATDDVAETLGTRYQDDLLKLSKGARASMEDLAAHQALHPRVSAQLAQSRRNAQRYKQETIQVLTEKLGSRAKAEAKYEALINHFEKKISIAANYTDHSLLTAMQNGKISTLYDLPVKTRLEKKGLNGILRTITDTLLGLRAENPKYVTVAGNKKYAREIAKYGNVQVRYKEADLAARTLFSDGNHNYWLNSDTLRHLNPRKALRARQFVWDDAPHLLVNRIVKEALDPTAKPRLIEGLVFDGINPRVSGEALTILRDGAKVEQLIQEAAEAGLKVHR